MTYSQNVLAFLRVIRQGETGQAESAYRMLFGGGLFDSYADHPRIKVTRGNLTSTAAGAYQFLASTWDECAKALGLSDFGPDNQDRAAVYLIQRRKALDDVEAGRIESAIAKCNREWASLPGSPYGQPTRTMEQALATYKQYGGTLANDQAANASEVTPVYAEALNQPKPTQYTPAGEFGPSEDFAAVPQEKPMSFADVINNPATKVLLGLVNPVLAAVPEVAKIFMDKDGTTVPERNVAAAIKIADVAQKALADAGKPADNMQAVAEAVASDPEAKRVVRAAVLDQCMYLAEAGSGGIDGARKADAVAMAAAGPWWQVLRSPSFWALLLLIPLVYLIVLSLIGVLGNVAWSQDARAGIAGMITGSIVGGAVGYYWGQTTSRNRTPQNP